MSDCYRIPQIVIGQHDHTDACYSMQQAELLCALTCYYYVVEKADPNYHASYQNNGGIQSGSITVINKQVITYELPETGGIGTQAYTLGGFTMAAGAVLWLCYRRKRRREDG